MRTAADRCPLLGRRSALDWALTSRPVIGTADDLLEVVEKAAEHLSTLGLEIERVPGLGHQFPQNYGGWLGTEAPNCG